MFRLHLQGLSICMLSKSKLMVVSLNSAVRKRYAPFHLHTLFVRPSSVDWKNTTLRSLPTIEGRWKTTAGDNEFRGFDLSGLAISIGQGSAPHAPTSQARAEGLQHPKSKTHPDWSDLHWVLDGKRLVPSGKLVINPVLGPDVLSTAEIRGGRLEGGEPQEPFGSQYIWYMRPGYQQALTDTLDVVYENGVPAVTFKDKNGRPAGKVVFKKGAEAWLTIDAPALDAQFAVAAAKKPRTKAKKSKVGPDLGDPALMLEVFKGSDSDMKKVRPRAVANWQTGFSFAGPSCPIFLVRQ